MKNYALTINRSDPFFQNGVELDTRVLKNFDVNPITLLTSLSYDQSAISDKQRIVSSQYFEKEFKTCMRYKDQIKALKLSNIPDLATLSSIIEAMSKNDFYPTIIYDVSLNNFLDNLNDSEYLSALKRDILVHTKVVIINQKEAEILASKDIHDNGDHLSLASLLVTLGPEAVILKNVVEGDKSGRVFDYVITDQDERMMEYLPQGEHGLYYRSVQASIITSLIAKGIDFEEAVFQSYEDFEDLNIPPNVLLSQSGLSVETAS